MTLPWFSNILADDKFLDSSVLKEFEDQKSNVATMTRSFL